MFPKKEGEATTVQINVRVNKRGLKNNENLIHGIPTEFHIVGIAIYQSSKTIRRTQWGNTYVLKQFFFIGKYVLKQFQRTKYKNPGKESKTANMTK